MRISQEELGKTRGPHMLAEICETCGHNYYIQIILNARAMATYIKRCAFDSKCEEKEITEEEYKLLSEDTLAKRIKKRLADPEFQERVDQRRAARKKPMETPTENDFSLDEGEHMDIRGDIYHIFDEKPPEYLTDVSEETNPSTQREIEQDSDESWFDVMDMHIPPEEEYIFEQPDVTKEEWGELTYLFEKDAQEDSEEEEIFEPPEEKNPWQTQEDEDEVPF